MRLALLKFRCNEITDYTHLARSSVCQAINQLLNLKYHLGSNKHILKSSNSLTPQLWQHPCWPTNSLPPQYISCSGLNSSTTILLQTKGFFCKQHFQHKNVAKRWSWRILRLIGSQQSHNSYGHLVNNIIIIYIMDLHKSIKVEC